MFIINPPLTVQYKYHEQMAGHTKNFCCIIIYEGLTLRPFKTKQRQRPIPGSDTKPNRDKRSGLGRGAILQQASNQPKPGVAHHYKPVSVEGGLPGAPPAIPGECAVHHSWRYLSNAPVAYQMQQMLDAKEGQSDTLLSFTQHTTTTAAYATAPTTTDLPEKAPLNVVHGGGASSTKDNNGGNGL
ncbi:hypothetical protein O3P69_013597 [Scylla paramamosain]|uniref:Uncharacterized protein n=1 Tax=Scylla paramamosain TaxID=85552 RepID=A0AAW0SNY2_SCYPA